MIGFIRLVIFGFIALTVVYISLSFYSRAVRRGKLQKDWEEGPQNVDRETYVQRGLERYDGSVRRKLILGVYVVPAVVVVAMIYLTNFA
jgi:uncharacterized membrane protein